MNFRKKDWNMLFQKVINKLFPKYKIIIKPLNKWSDLGNWNDFNNIGSCIKVIREKFIN